VDIVHSCTTKHDVWLPSKERRGGDRLKKIGRRKNFRHLRGDNGILCLNRPAQENRDFLFIFLFHFIFSKFTTMEL